MSDTLDLTTAIEKALRKVRANTNMNQKERKVAFTTLGLNPEPVKTGRKITGWTLDGPNGRMSYTLRNGFFRSMMGPAHRLTGAALKRYHRDEREHTNLRKWLVKQASAALAMPHPSENTPKRARDFRTDLTIRTCPVCFRDIKLSHNAPDVLSDHGYTEHRGYRSGSCTGARQLPYEVSNAATIETVERLVRRLATVRQQLETAKGEMARYHLDAEVKELTGPWFGSIAWYRMAARVWAPVADDVIAVGAPFAPRIDADFEGMEG